MLAMPSFDDYVELLDVALTHEKKPVTVKWLSRQISVNVNQAKRILKSYIDAKEDQHFHLIYVVSGVTPDDGLKTFLVREDEVEAAKKKLKIAYTPYVYCVTPSRLKNSNSVCLVNTEAIESQEGNPSKFASIINPEVQKIDMRLSKPAVSENHAKKQVASSVLRSNSNGPSNSASSSSGANAASTASRKSSIPKKPVSKTASSFFNNFRKGSGSAKEADNSKNKDKIIDQEKSEKDDAVTSEKDMDVVMDEAVDIPIIEKPKSKNSKGEKRKGADADADDDIATKKNAVKKRKVIMEDDEEDEEDTHVNAEYQTDISQIFDSDVNVHVASASAPQSPVVVSSGSGDSDVAVIDLDVDKVNEEDAAANGGNEEVTGGMRRVKKKRKVKKRKTFVDERNRLVTQDVWESEYYSEEEPISAPLSKSRSNSALNSRHSSPSKPQQVETTETVNEDEKEDGKKKKGAKKDSSAAGGNGGGGGGKKKGKDKDKEGQRSLLSFFGKK